MTSAPAQVSLAGGVALNAFDASMFSMKTLAKSNSNGLTGLRSPDGGIWNIGLEMTSYNTTTSRFENDGTSNLYTTSANEASGNSLFVSGRSLLETSGLHGRIM